jgi:peptidoglycan hydrolase-like protein with peptidoglycan-binding domain
MDPSIEARRGSGRLRRRRNLLIAIASLAVVASVGGILVSTTIKSPAQLAAQSASPGLTQLTVPAIRQVITSTVLAQGKVTQPPEVSQLSGASGGGGAAGGTGAGVTLPVVTKIFRPAGSQVTAGNVIVEVAGQPLFAFQGSVPAYRNLAPGESGTDVDQLQSGLQSLGYSTGSDAAGVFGAGTQAAVAAYYQAIGYSVPTVSTGPKADRGPMVPLAEILFVPQLPARVVKVAGPVGQEATGSLVTLSMGIPAVAGQLSPSDAALVRPGMTVTISDPATGSSRPGSVSSVGQRTATSGSISGGVYVPVTVIPDSPLPTSMIGQDVALTIAAAHSAGPVLAVPEAAIFARANGLIYVTKVTRARGDLQVPVRVGVTGDGMVGITPIGGGTLAAGDPVVTGVNYARTPARVP